MSTTRSIWRVVVAMFVRGAVALAVLAPASPAFAQARTLEGVWGIVTQDRNCTTNAPQGPPTRAVITYEAGGTLSESTYIPVFAIGQRSQGHGTWSHDGGLTYAARTLTMILFDTPPGTAPGLPFFQAGWQVATNTITLSGPDNFTAVGSSQFFNLNREVYRVGCASRVGERFK